MDNCMELRFSKFFILDAKIQALQLVVGPQHKLDLITFAKIWLHKLSAAPMSCPGLFKLLPQVILAPVWTQN